MLATAGLGLRGVLSAALESACSTSGRVECVRRITTSTRCERIVLAPNLDVRPVEEDGDLPPTQPELVEKYLDVAMLPKRKQQHLKLQDAVKDFQRFPGDVGSSEVQIARLTRKIADLAQHLAEHRKDHSSRRGLLAMLTQRRSLLQYLRRSNFDAYAMTISKLGLKDNYAQHDRYTVRYKPAVRGTDSDGSARAGQ